MNSINFSIIIPHKDSLATLFRLLDSIILDKSIEIIVVDNSVPSISKKDIPSNRHVKLVYSDPKKRAGGARNRGLEIAIGKWVIFADADDFFPDNIFETFFGLVDSTADLIYFKMNSVFSDSLQKASRGDYYSNLVDGFLLGDVPEDEIRLRFGSPCSKMIRLELIKEYQIRYDEVLASEDAYFQMLVGFYAKNIEVISIPSYVATIQKGSTTNRRGYDFLLSSYLVVLRMNVFLKNNNKMNYQSSIMFYLYSAFQLGPRAFFSFVRLALEYKQSPFVGYSKWLTSFRSYRKKKREISKYIIRS